jgi:hypothetical protein
MSDSFKTYLVKDSTINDITSDLGYCVKSGAASYTNQQFPATAQNASTMIFSVQVPSENIVIGRDILIETTLAFKFQIGSSDYPVTREGSFEDANVVAIANNLILDWGNTASLRAFPLATLMNTASATINNTSVSTNVKDVLPQLLRLNDSRYLYKYNGMTPSLPDQAYQEYVDAPNANNNPMASWNTASYDIDQVPRGAHPVQLYAEHYGSGGSYDAGGTLTVLTGVLIDNSLRQANWIDAGAPVAPAPAYTYYDQQWWVVEVKTKITEPLFISPFTWSSPEHNAQGLLGINNMAFNFSMDSTLSKLICDGTGLVTNSASGSNQPAIRGMTAGAPELGQSGLFEASNMLLKFLSTQPSDRLETKNVVPYMDFPRYITNANSGQTVASLGTTSVLSNNIQLNQIPDYFLICVRKPMTQQTIQDADSFFRINGISVNINNASGLLSSATQQDLWKMSMRNGSTQSWAEFSGEQWNTSQSATGEGANVKTTGSLLVLSPPYDLSLPDYLTSGSLGNFNFQIRLDVQNLSSKALVPEVCVVCVNSGIFVTSQGVSSVYSGILTREMTLKTKSTSAESSIGEEKMSGGMMQNRHPLRKMMKGMKGGRLVGGEMSAGARSGGALSGMY